MKINWTADEAAQIHGYLHELWPSAKKVTPLEFETWQEGLGRFHGRTVLRALKAAKVANTNLGRPTIPAVAEQCKRIVAEARRSATTADGRCRGCDNLRIVSVKAYLAERHVGNHASCKEVVGSDRVLVLPRVAESAGIAPTTFNIRCPVCRWRLARTDAAYFEATYGKQYLVFASERDEEAYMQMARSAH